MATISVIFLAMGKNLGHGIFFMAHGPKKWPWPKKCGPWEKWKNIYYCLFLIEMYMAFMGNGY